MAGRPSVRDSITWPHYTSSPSKVHKKRSYSKGLGMRPQYAHLMRSHTKRNENPERCFLIHNFGIKKSSLAQSQVETSPTGPPSAASLGELMSTF